ncbi:MAG: Flp pilus assembly protein TadD, partial [Flavobacteriales bacterium]
DPEPQLMLGVIHIEGQRPIQAEEALRSAITRGANDGYVWSNLGSALIGQGRNDDAINALQTATAQGPDLPHAHFMLGTAYANTGQQDAANQSFCRAADLEPNRTAFTSRCSR